jgi:DNA modification methylase
MESAGYTRQQLADIVGCTSNLIRKWTLQGNPQWCLPTPAFYAQLRKVLNLDGRYDFMLTRQSVFVKAPLKGFSYQHDCYILDEKQEELLHPAQKPLSVVTHVVECIAPKDGIVLDAFAGSGTTALGALATERNFICFEVSEQFCDVARRRIAEVNVKL